MSQLEGLLTRAKKSSDVVLAVVVAAILGAMVVPLPPWLVDVGIAVNLVASVSLLVAALYAQNALKVAAFPTLLLLTTLFRLALNVSSTRLALSDGHAGDIIQAFGEFVVRGDYVVGAVVFVILTLVQFLVVAKGAERVAEVSARFTLDAMPGKQMSIDADLRAGAIDQAQARARRKELERESQLFGAMDGAMKFVKGDVVASLVIVLVNLLGGTAMGVLQGGLELGEAAATYALLSIGDGLVSQLPSLCIAIAAGLVVTRVNAEADDGSLGAEIGYQFFGQWKALFVVGGLSIALAAVPGMPAVTFLLLAAACGAVGYGLKLLHERRQNAPGQPSSSPTSASLQAKSQEPAVGVSPLVLDLASNLTEWAQADGGKLVHEDLQRLKEQLFYELGLRLPGIRVRTGASYLPAGGYALQIDEVPCGSGQIVPGEIYALAAPSDVSSLGFDVQPATEPVSLKSICRLPAEARPRLEAAQVATRTATQLVTGHLAALLRKRAASLLGVQEVQALLEALEPVAPALVKEALHKVPLPLLTDVLRQLLREEVSIRNLRCILEALVSPTTEGDVHALAEKCRQALHHYLSHKYAPGGPLFAFLVDPAVEEALREGGGEGALDPAQVGGILEGVHRIAQGGRAVLLASPDVRRTLRRLIEGAFPEVAVLTYGELDADLQVKPIGRLAAL
ncbi:MAG: FHIPEP family type III secretion protein [Myxococcota bacterium]